MITKVQIENFQSHKKTELEFVPGTNVIIGQSDTGKSAVFRAINWVISNRPLGDAFRSEWGGSTRVSLYMNDGNIVERVRSDNINEYRLNGETLKAFGSEVPKDIADTIQLDNCNIHSQMDTPFLLAMSPGEAARMLNKAASIDDIDHTTSSLRKSLNKISSEIQYDEAQLEEQKQEAEKYANLPKIEEKIEQAEELERQRQEIKRQYESIFSAVQRTVEIEEEMQATKGVEQALIIIADAEESAEQLKKLEQERNTIKKLTQRLREMTSKIQRTGEIIEQLENEFSGLMPEICPLCETPVKGRE